VAPAPCGRARLGAVLGVSALAHDPAAALIIDGRLVAAVEEERLSRQKRAVGFPRLAVQHVLEAGGVDLHEIDRVAYYWNDRGRLPAALLAALRQAPSSPRGSWRVARQRLGSFGAPSALVSAFEPLLSYGRRLPPVTYVDHHRAHLAAAWLSAPFEAEAAVVIDGRGEVESTTLFDLRGGPGLWPRVIETYAFPDSLGIFYGAITQVLGYRPNSDEYKVMGLASYGNVNPAWERRVARLMHIDDRGQPHLDVRRIRPENCARPDLPWLTERGRGELDDSFVNDDGGFTQAAFDLAYAAQSALEEAVLALLRRVVAATGARRVVVVGGVAMNAAAVGRARASGIVEELHVPLAPTDAGAAVGAALEVLRTSRQPVPPSDQLDNPFLGPGFTPAQLEAALVTSKLPFRRSSDVAAEAAEAIAAGKLVGWFQGRMEFGERALGARSVLGDPRKTETRDRINASVKRRESYRPFAPSVLEERSAEYFATAHSRRMAEIVRATPAACREAPAVVHVDGTARPQTVPRDWPAHGFRRLIELFDRATGVPMVINTSFNLSDEPIVCSPDDAIRCFAVSGLDTLYLGDLVVDKADFHG